jgi:hypothetical protein
MSTTEEAIHCIQNRFRSHGNEHPKHSKSKERDNSTVEAGDLHAARPEPTSGIQNTEEDNEKRSLEMKIQETEYDRSQK